ncbi:MAG: DUF1553 domain-containing protein [Planctomycetes bacterium]|nr:DUF1553 domain-containing protein [Planctomycetota bacterium]
MLFAERLVPVWNLRIQLLTLASALCATTLFAQGPLRVLPDAVTLSDPFARRQLLVEADGKDVTRSAKYASSQTNVATVDESGYLLPVADGTTEISITVNGQTSTVPVTVKGMANARAIDFSTEIVPLLSRFGCNSGGCHGKQGGQNGFQLSLFGFDTEFDYSALVKEARGRRVNVANASGSLLLRKAVGSVPHGGGRRIEVGSEPYRLLLSWIESSAPASSPEVPRVVKLHVSPKERVLKKLTRSVSEGGRPSNADSNSPSLALRVSEQVSQQQLAVIAEYSDGSQRDVTRQTDYSSNLDVVASVSADGLVKTTGQSGEAAIMTRYMGQVAVFLALVPHGEPLKEITNFTPKSEIDRLVVEKWKKLGLKPSPLVDDATFLRRVTLDLCGRLPTSDEVRAFLNDATPTKREGAVDRLLDSPDYPAFFALRWGSILRNSNLAGADRASYAFNNWIKDQVARNVPYDEFARGVIAASGEWQDAPPVNRYWQMRDDLLHQSTADTAQVFLGLRLQCAKCHHHPYERYSQEDYYGLSGFFTRLGQKSFGEPPPYFNAPTVTRGEQNPLTKQSPKPKFLDGDYTEFSSEQDPRHALVDWMAKPENPYFARTMVNRLWGHFFGRGIVHEVDDLRETNPPSNPELLKFLSDDFLAHQFDIKHAIRQMVTSQAYQLSSQPTPDNEHDRQNYARFYARRLIAEVFLDSVNQATGVRDRFNGVGTSARAIDLPHENFGSYFLDAFDRPKRVTACECERSPGATLAQVLLLSNSDEIENKLSSGEGKIGKFFAIPEKDRRPLNNLIEELYLGSLSRLPSSDELTTATKYLEGESDKRQAVEDLLWALLNSKEFMFNH